MMVSKKPFKAYKCTNLPIKNPWLPKASPPSKKTKCTYLGERYAGPFGESHLPLTENRLKFFVPSNPTNNYENIYIW